ncbi:MAG TPA: hypothetical protein PLN52_11400 [Opitutaceae bacterium]|nr:hypothetical protein [Opitutaceae bacterium]
MKLRLLFSFGLLCAVIGLMGCVHVTLDPIKVHAVVDVNVKVDRALTDFFGDLDQKSAVLQAPAP